MNYKIIPTKEFVKDFKKVDPTLKSRLKKKIEEISIDPTRYKYLHPPLNNSCRVRVGKLRIIFSFNLETKELYLEKIVFKHRY